MSSSTKPCQAAECQRWVWAILIATFTSAAAKLWLMGVTGGTIDLFLFRSFARLSASQGWEGLGQTTAYWNHAIPMWVACGWAWRLQEWCGVPFGWLWRLPCVFADIVVVVMLLVRYATNAAMLKRVFLIAISPLSVLISGHHGNTDPVMVMLLVATVLLIERNAWIAAGVGVGLALWIKVVALLPATAMLYWAFRKSGKDALRFAGAVGGIVAIGWWPILFQPPKVLSRILSYGGIGFGDWGIPWAIGILPETPWAQILKVLALCALALGVVASQQKKLSLWHGLALGWCGFLFFAPAGAIQYLIWIQPFLLLAAPRMGLLFVLTGTAWAWVFYTVNLVAEGGGVSLPRSECVPLWTPWAGAVWLVLGASAVVLATRKPVTSAPELPSGESQK